MSQTVCDICCKNHYNVKVQKIENFIRYELFLITHKRFNMSCFINY